MLKQKIYIFGIGGLYNYGCEAIVRGLESIIRKRYPEAEIIYLSYRAEQDKGRLIDSTLRIIPVPMNYLCRMINKIQSILKMSIYRRFVNIRLGWVRKEDVFISVGGDVYNLAKSERIQQKKYKSVRVKIGEKIKKKDAYVLIWGASIGPFEENITAKKYLINYFQKSVDSIIAREKNTVVYLKNNGVNNVHYYSDPAYAIDSPVKESFSNITVIGINLSPLSSLYSSNEELSDIVREQAKQIIKLIKRFDAEVVLIPHVIANHNVKDDDLRYLQMVYQSVASENKNIRLIDSDPGFVGLKKHLIRCDVVIAARMHCAINAVCCAVPTIFVGYSDKASGMCKHVFGNLDYYIDIKEFNKIGDVTDRILTKKTLVHQYLLKRRILMMDDALNSGCVLSQFLN